MPFFAFVSGLFLALYLTDLALLRALHRSWWYRRWVRRIALAVPVMAIVGLVAWSLGHRLESQALVRLGAGTVSILFVQLAALLVALLITLPVRLVEIGWDLCRRSAPNPEQLMTRSALEVAAPPVGVADSPERRRFLRAALASVSLTTAAAASAGTLQSTNHPRLPRIRLRYPDLPADLRGLRILQISDCHVGPYIGLDDLERLVERAAALSPDLVVVTGDICDHMPDYQSSLTLLEQLSPRLGVFASLGNHEYFRGIQQVHDCFERSTIPLLVDEGVVLSVGDARLRIAGADDPRSLRDPSAHGRLRTSVERALDGADSDAFQLLMSHRSTAFDFAAGVHLTLAGHTHGYQLGFGGRSFFERWYPNQYIWGHYGGGNRQLYTSAGVGHWFPFRLGCPPEAPLFVLEKA